MAAECAADQLLGGRYALLEVLGHGASGVVWRARDQLLQRDVAVKEIRSPLVVGAAETGAFRDAILREARVAARLNHPGAVTVYDVVEDDGRPLIVMELVDAPTLAEMVEAGGPLPPAEVAAIGTELLDALDAGHGAGIVHRDVKPGNVMVDGSGRVRLADFGVASVLDDTRITTGGEVIGSPAYMAPEQVTGDDIGRPADMWALGATLYFAVEGRPPYDKGTAVPTMMAIVRERPRPHAQAGALGPVLDALLAKDPADRPSAAFLRLWLAEVAGGAHGPGPDGRTGSDDRSAVDESTGLGRREFDGRDPIAGPDGRPGVDGRSARDGRPGSDDGAGSDMYGAGRIDSTSRYPVAPSAIEVPEGPGGPLGPGPTGPGGPVVIPKPTPPEVPTPTPTPPTPTPPTPTPPTPTPPTPTPPTPTPPTPDPADSHDADSHDADGAFTGTRARAVAAGRARPGMDTARSDTGARTRSRPRAGAVGTRPAPGAVRARPAGRASRAADIAPSPIPYPAGVGAGGVGGGGGGGAGRGGARRRPRGRARRRRGRGDP